MLNTINYGCYDSPAVNTLITQAEGASTLSRGGGRLAPGGRATS